jgi:hypothetical protein
VKIYVYIFIGIISFSLFSCATEISGEGDISTVTYSPGANPTKISVDHDIDVTVKYGTIKKVHVTGYKNLIDYVKISATGGVLRIGMKPDYTYTNMNLSAIIEIPYFSELAITHEGNIEVDTFYNAITNLNLIITGSGNITALHHLQANNLYADLKGSGSVLMNGSTYDEEILISGTGNFNGFKMYSSNCTVNISGDGNAEVNPKFLLSANISGAGSIFYKRYPVINSTLTGSGLVIDSN